MDKQQMNESQVKAVVRKALYKLGHPDVSPQDYEDLQQEAALALWKNANRYTNDADRSRAYAFGAAVNETIKAFIRQIIGHNPYACELPVDGHGDEEIEHIEHSPERQLSNDVLEALTEIFISARTQRVGRARDAAMRDVVICAMVYSGHNNRSIAHELNIPVRHVQTYRRRLRATLRRYCEEHGLVSAEKRQC